MNVNTERLHIRDIARADLDAMIDLWMDPIIKLRMGSFGPQASDEVLPWIEDAITHNETRPRFAHNSVMVVSASDRVAGWIGFGQPNESGIGDLDFGYAVLPDFRGRGYATEALAALIEFCFVELEVNSVWAKTMSDNLASARVMEKVGMRRIGMAEDGQIVFRIEKRAGHDEGDLKGQLADPA